MWIEKNSPFEAWRNKNLQGIAVSKDVLELIAKAFEGGQGDMKEKCAKVCESEWSNVAERMYGQECAAAIRAIGDNHE